MSQKSRHEQIIELIRNHGAISNDDLVSYFGVTPQTIRRDLTLLAEDGQIVRHHGARLNSSTKNTAYQIRKIMNLEQKKQIARELVNHIPDGASLFINIGTTTETIARELLNHNNLQVVTNNIHVATTLNTREDFRVIIAAGEVRYRDGGIVGEATVDLINQFRMDYAIIGIRGIGDDGSLLDFDYQEVRVAQAIIKNSREVMLAADHSKFGRNAMVRLGSIEQANHFFTDNQPPANFRRQLADNDVQLHIAGHPVNGQIEQASETSTTT